MAVNELPPGMGRIVVKGLIFFRIKFDYVHHIKKSAHKKAHVHATKTIAAATWAAIHR